MKKLKKRFFFLLPFIIFILVSIFFASLDKVEKKGSPYRSLGGAGGKKKIDSLRAKIIFGGKDKLDSLLLINDSLNLKVLIPFSKKIKFTLLAIENNKKVFLLDTASKKQIRFLSRLSIWRGLNQKEFRGIERY